jgi:hypothetical protein
MDTRGHMSDGERTEYTCGECGKKMFNTDPQEERERWRRTTWDQLWYFPSYGKEHVSFLSCGRECRLKQLARHGVVFGEAESHEALQRAAEAFAQKERTELETQVRRLEQKLEVLKAAWESGPSPSKAVTMDDLKELIRSALAPRDLLRPDERARQAIPIGSDLAEDQLKHAAALEALADLDKALEPIDPESRLGSRMERALAVTTMVSFAKRVLARWDAFDEAVRALQLEVELGRSTALGELSARIDEVRKGIGGQP